MESKDRGGQLLALGRASGQCRAGKKATYRLQQPLRSEAVKIPGKGVGQVQDVHGVSCVVVHEQDFLHQLAGNCPVQPAVDGELGACSRQISNFRQWARTPLCVA